MKSTLPPSGILVLALSLAACGGVAAPAMPTQPIPTTMPTRAPTPQPTMAPTPIPPVEGAYVTSLPAADAAGRLGTLILAGDQSATLASCPAGSLYDAYMRGLRAAATYVISDGDLIMNMKMGGGTLTFSNRPIAAMKRVTGTVTYLQRIALPPAAVVTVKLVDISRQDAPAIVRTEQVIRADGKQVPFAFELAYDPASIDTRFTYAVQAQIAEADAKLLFITDTNYPMITRGNPTKIEIILKMA